MSEKQTIFNVIKLLEATLGEMPARNADEVVRVAIEMLKNL